MRSQSSPISEAAFIKSVETGLCVSQKTFLQNLKSLGLRMTIKSSIAKFRYTLRLSLVRELAIINYLLNNYGSIPRGTPTYHFITFVKRSALMKNLVYKLAKNLHIKL